MQEDAIGSAPDSPVLGWAGTRPFGPAEAGRLRQAARFVAAPLAALAARAALAALLEAYLGRRSAARVQAGALRRGTGETIRAALLYADLRDFTAMSETTEPAAMIAALDAWFDRVAGAVHAFGGEVLKFIGDGVLAIFPVTGAPAEACEAALRAVVAARAGMAHLDAVRQAQGLPPLPFGAALHLGEMLWGNIGAADRLDFTAIGPAVNLVSRLEGLCRPLGRSVLISGAVAAETTTPLVPLGEHVLRGISGALQRLHPAGRMSGPPPPPPPSHLQDDIVVLDCDLEGLGHVGALDERWRRARPRRCSSAPASASGRTRICRCGCRTPSHARGSGGSRPCGSAGSRRARPTGRGR